MVMRDDSRTTPNIGTNSGIPRTFNQVRKSVLNTVNWFLHDMEASLVVYGLQVDQVKGECGGRLSGLFIDTGIIGILQAYDTLNMVSTFVGAMIDQCCGLENCPTTTCYAR